MKEKCLKENLKTKAQIEVKILKTYMSEESARREYYPLEKIKVNGVWGEIKMIAAVEFIASIEY